MGQMNSALVRAIWVFTLCLLVCLVLFGSGFGLFSAAGLLGLGAFSLALGWIIRRRTTREDELSPGTAYPTRKVRRERDPGEGNKYRREPKVAENAPPPLPAEPAAPEPAPAATDEKERVSVKIPSVVPPRGHREPSVSVRRDFWARARQRLEASEPVDLSQGNIMELEQGRRVDRPVLEPTRFDDVGTKILVPPKMGVPRFDACFDLAGMRDYTETRVWTAIPELVDAERLQHVRNRAEAIEKLETVRDKYPDFDRIYLWIARVLRQDGRADDATQVLLQGLAEARAKAPILTGLGIYAVEDGRMADAVRWLVRAVALQKGGGQASSALAFRYLACLASPHPRLSEASNWLNAEAGRIDEGGGHLMRSDAEYCTKLSQTNTQPWMIDVVDALYGFYATRVSTKMDPAET